MSDKELNLIFKLVALVGVMTIVVMKTTKLSSISLGDVFSDWGWSPKGNSCVIGLIHICSVVD